MARYKKEITITLLTLFLVFLGTASMRLANEREYKRSNSYFDGTTYNLYYPTDFFYSWWQRKLVGIGQPVGFLVLAVLFYLVLSGTKKFLDEKFRDASNYFKCFTYIIALWILLNGISFYVTSPGGMIFFLKPILKSKIYYGGYDRVLRDISEEIDYTRQDKSLTAEEIDKKINKLRIAYKRVLTEKEEEMLLGVNH